MNDQKLKIKKQVKKHIPKDWLCELRILYRLSMETFNDIRRTGIVNLVIITTDLTKFSCQEFSKAVTPEFEVAQAIKISSSMPGLMAPYKYKDSYLVDGDLQKASPMWRLSDTVNNCESRILEFRLEGDYSKDEKNPIALSAKRVNAWLRTTALAIEVFFLGFGLPTLNQKRLEKKYLSEKPVGEEREKNFTPSNDRQVKAQEIKLFSSFMK